MKKKFPAPQSELGEPKKKFSETFSIIPTLIEHFKLKYPIK